MTATSRTLVSLAFLFFSPITRAQEFDAAETRISARADVRLSVESGPRTDSAKLGVLAAAVGQRMADVRACYDRRFAQDAAVQGRVGFWLEATPGRTRLEMRRDEVRDEALVRCATRALSRVTVPREGLGGSAYLWLEFVNSAAEGAVLARERRAVEDRAELVRTPSGEQSSSGGTPQGEVQFRVTSRADEEEHQTVHRALRTLLPGLLDCRRRAAKRTTAAQELLFRVMPRGQMRSLRSATADERTQSCVQRVLTRARARPRSSFDLQIQFGAHSAPSPAGEPDCAMPAPEATSCEAPTP